MTCGNETMPPPGVAPGTTIELVRGGSFPPPRLEGPAGLIGRPVSVPAVSRAAYRQAGTLALTCALVACVLITAARAAASVADFGLAGQLHAAPTSVSVAQIDAAQQRREVLAGVTGIVFLITAFLFIRWTRRMYRNLTPLGVTELRYSNGWAVGAWFVPVLNLVRPKQIIDDTWRAMREDGKNGCWHINRVRPIIHVWWAALVVGLLLYSKIRSRAGDLLDLRRQLVLETVAMVSLGVAAAAATGVVLRLSDQQRHLAATRAERDPSVAVARRARHWSVPMPALLGTGTFVVALVLMYDTSRLPDGTNRAARDAFGAVSAAGSVLIGDLAVNDCSNETGLDPAANGEVVEMVGIEVVPCHDAHDSEVFAITRVSARSAQSLSDRALIRYAENRCEARFEDIAGVSVDETALDITVLVSSPNLDGGDRQIVCSVNRADGLPFEAQD